MINLLRECPATSALVRIFSEHPPVPLLPVLGDARWTAALANPVLARVHDELVRRAWAELDEPLPELTDALYRDFAATGVRLHFERVYFERRRRLARAAVALLAVGGEELARSFRAKLEAIFAEESWSLPAHVSNPTGRDPKRIDLFAAETANLMAECLNVFSPVLTEAFQADVLRRLRTDVFENYRDNPEAMGWTKISNNWNSVCHQGVLGAALAVERDPELLASLVKTAAGYLPRFLGGFGADGGCSEGPGYWVYGFGWFAVLNEQLETRTAGALSFFEGDEKVRSIARYGPLVCLAGQNLVNFADAPQQDVVRPSLLAYLGQRLDVESCGLQAGENYARLASDGTNYEAERADLFSWLRLFLFCPAALPAVAAALKENVFFENLEVWVVRGRDDAGRLWEVAAKGGHNDEHHNHNDLGSFILNIDGVPLITEIGAPEYVRDFFSDKRYQFLAARSLGHSLPVINGCEQREGAGFKSRILCAETQGGTLTFQVDLTAAYPAEARCLRCVRTLTFNQAAGELRWEDEFELSEAGIVESAVITDATAVTLVSATVARIEKDGRSVELRSGADASWDRVETQAYRGHEGDDRSVRRLVLKPAAPAARIRLTVTVAAA